MTIHTDKRTLPDDMNPAMIAACARFIGNLTGLVPPQIEDLPPDMHAAFRAFAAEVYGIVRANIKGQQTPCAAARFAGAVLKEHRNEGYPGDVDGDWLQDLAVECGLIEAREVSGPCGECCVCAEFGDFPTECYFNTEAGRACIDAAMKASHAKGGQK